jgi:coenzyme PQQ precursor peptide PqqA
MEMTTGAGSVRTRRACTIESIWNTEEVIAMEKTPMTWETPEFEEIGTSAEVTAYAGIWPESE